MFLEYGALIGASFDLDAASIIHILLVIFSGLILIAVGFAVKGVWGAITAFGLGVIGYLYWNRLLPF